MIRKTLLLSLLAAGALTASAAVAGPFGPAKFKIETSDDRFSADGLVTVTGHNNRLSNRSMVGGTYIDGEGVYLDPMVVKGRADGKIRRVGFAVHYDTYVGSSVGTMNLFGGMKKISFLVDGAKLISANINEAGQHQTGGASYNPYLRSTDQNVSETGTITLTLADMAALASAHTVAVKIEGGGRSWTCEATQVGKQFLPNLATFHQQQIATTAR